MDELWEAVSWAQLGYHDSPVGLLNADGFYDGLLEFYHRWARPASSAPEHRGILIAEQRARSAARQMAGYVPHKPIFR
jgi:predicted Rossmann-fold nucleotide-binding protein